MVPNDGKTSQGRVDHVIDWKLVRYSGISCLLWKTRIVRVILVTSFYALVRGIEKNGGSIFLKSHVDEIVISNSPTFARRSSCHTAGKWFGW